MLCCADCSDAAEQITQLQEALDDARSPPALEIALVMLGRIHVLWNHEPDLVWCIQRASHAKQLQTSAKLVLGRLSSTVRMPANSPNTRLRIRIYFSNGSMFGPGKADLLMLISETGSIAAAGRRLGMSYKRAWGLVETMNAMFAEPIVESSRGGATHGGATVTAAGVRVLALYRALENKSISSSATEIESLQSMTAPSQVRNSDMSGRN